MSTFTTRVELHKTNNIEPTSEDYKTLHKEMSKEGFLRTITSGDNIKYNLPEAEYNYDGIKTKSEILAKATAAAEKTKKKHSILVTESAGRTWNGLEKS